MILTDCKKTHSPKGFTLIELLVVVLIIGILAAVAFPQYEKAVVKSQMARVLPWFKALKEGRDLYILNGGKSNCGAIGPFLDLMGMDGYEKFCTMSGTCPPPPESECGLNILTVNKDLVIVNNDGSIHWTMRKGNYWLGYAFMLGRGKLYCIARDDYKGAEVCQSLAPQSTAENCGAYVSYGGFLRASKCYEMPI